MPDLRGLVADPDFNALPAEQKRALLQRIGADPGFIDELLGGSSAPVAAPEKKGFLDILQEGARNALQTQVPGILADILPGGGLAKNPLTGTASIEQGLENAPVLGGALGALAGPGGAIAGAAIGESGRQLTRRAAGLPASTGLVQRLLDLDPDSPEAAISGLGAETLIGPVAHVGSKVLKAASKFMDESSLRSLIHLLKPVKQMDTENALELAAKLRESGIASPLSTRTGQIKKARAALADASTKLDASKAPYIAAGADLPTQSIHDKVLGAIPEVLPSGNVPLTGAAERAASERAAYDVLDATGGDTRMPLKTALSEKERTDRALRKMYIRGQVNVPVGAEYTKNAADAFRNAIHENFKDVGADMTSKSELLDINRLLRDALKQVKTAGTSASEAGASLGGAAAGRWSIPFINSFQKIVRSGPIASFSAFGKTLISKILDGGAEGAQLWMRISDQFNLDDESEGGPKAERREDLDLRELAKSILDRQAKPAEPAVSEEEFIKRYQ